MSEVSEFRYAKRAYIDALTDYTSKYKNKPKWLFEQRAGMFDLMSEILNAVALDILNPQTRLSAYAFARANDYDPLEADGAICESVKITLREAMNKTLPVGYQIGGISLQNGEYVYFELLSEASSGGTDTINTTAKQKRTHKDVRLGSLDSEKDFAEVPIENYTGLIKNSIQLTIDGITWAQVENFDGSDENDRHFKVQYNSGGEVWLMCGGDGRGMVFPKDAQMYVSFEATLGLKGRMDVGEINQNIGQDSDILELTNTAETSGGNDSETVTSIVRNARRNNRLRDAVWSVEDTVTAALKATSSVVKAKAVKGDTGATVYIVPAGGGYASEEVKTLVANFVKSLTAFQSETILCFDTVYTPVDIDAVITMQAGYDPARAKRLAKFALTLCTSAIDIQVLDVHESFGVDRTRTSIINNYWAWNFPETDNEYLDTIIQLWKSRLKPYKKREYGQNLELGDAWIMGDSLTDVGVQTFNITNLTGNIPCSANSIIDTGVVTVTVNE